MNIGHYLRIRKESEEYYLEHELPAKLASKRAQADMSLLLLRDGGISMGVTLPCAFLLTSFSVSDYMILFSQFYQNHRILFWGAAIVAGSALVALIALVLKLMHALNWTEEQILQRRRRSAVERWAMQFHLSDAARDEVDTQVDATDNPDTVSPASEP